MCKIAPLDGNNISEVWLVYRLTCTHHKLQNYSMIKGMLFIHRIIDFFALGNKKKQENIFCCDIVFKFHNNSSNKFQGKQYFFAPLYIKNVIHKNNCNNCRCCTPTR